MTSSNAARREPRRSQLSGRHPAVPAGDPDENPQTPPATDAGEPIPGTPPLPGTPPFPVEVEAGATSKKLTVNVPSDLIDAAKDAFWLARGDYRTFSAWVEDAMRRHIEQTKTAHGVDVLPPRPGGSLPTGRPVG